MTNESQTTQDELSHRHRTATIFVVGFLLMDVVLLAITYFAAERIVRLGDPAIIMALWIGILVCGFGAFVLRRTKFSTMRLKDVAALRGTSGLLKTLQQTTIQVALLGGAIGLMGFAWAMLTRDWTNMLRAAGVSVVVLIYCYPFRSAWERVVISLASQP
jgi:hypothetical protein